MPPSRRPALSALALVAALVVGCGSPAPSGPAASGTGAPGTPGDPATSPSPLASGAPSPVMSPPEPATPTPQPTPTPAPTPTMAIAPLTGRLVREANALRHPIAVMIDDLWAARPQSGLSEASVVWQAPAEAGIPRYMAIFAEGNPKAVGPVRSARYYFIGWAAEWRAVYAHAGGSPQALAALRSKGSGQLVYNADQFRWGRYFWRIKQRYAPHNLYTDGKHLRSLAKALKATDPPAKAIWRFAPDAPLEARPVGGRIDVTYPHNAVRYRYDRKTNTYRRFVSGGKKDIDAAHKVQIAPKNVIVMVMRFGPLTGAGSGHGRLEARLIGSGKAWISTNGRTIKGTWKKSSMTGPTRFYDANGKQVTLTIGQTYVQVIQSGTPVRFVAGKPAASPSPAPTGASPGPSASPGS